MIEELIKKLNIVLQVKFPDEKEREEKLEKAGQIILFETLEEVAKLLNDSEKEEMIYTLVAKEKISDAFDLITSAGIDVEEILQRKGKEVSMLLFQM